MSEFINTIDVLGDDAVIDSIIDRSITEFKDNVITKIGNYVFSNCAALETVDLPNVTGLSAYLFSGCTALKSVTLSKITGIGAYSESFRLSCPNAWFKFPLLTSVGYYGLRDCTVFAFECSSKVTFENGTNPFGNLGHLILRSETMCVAKGSTLPNANYVYVPSALVDTYKAATNWSAYADKFKAIEDYTVDGTATGEFIRCSGVELDKTSLTFDEGKRETLTATILTPSPFGIDEVKWSSGDESIAVVNNGVVTPVGKGTTTITASCNGYSATCEVVSNVDGLYVICEVGNISHQTGVDEADANRFRTTKIPYDSAINTFRADVVVNGNTSSTARLLLRPYKADGTFDTTNFASAITPSAINNWALSGTDYTINYPSDVAYVRAVFTDATDTAASTLNGTITVSGITYSLAQGG